MQIMNKIKYKVLLVIALFFFMNTHSSTMLWKPLPVRIEIAEIIFEGVVIDIYSQVEPDIKSQYSQYENGKVVRTWEGEPQIFTTFVFKIKDILKGEYLDDQIEVKMLGGCDNDNCIDYSFGYHYNIGDTAVMFVSLNKKNNYYKRSDYSSPYTLKGSLGLLTISGAITYLQELDENNEIVLKDVLTLAILKNKIEELEAQ